MITRTFCGNPATIETKDHMKQTDCCNEYPEVLTIILTEIYKYIIIFLHNNQKMMAQVTTQNYYIRMASIQQH